MHRGALIEPLVAILLLALAALWVRRREGTGDRLAAVHLVLVVLVVDASLFPAGGSSTGVFVLPVNDRTTNVLLLLVPLLLVMRWSTGRDSLGVTTLGLAWTAFLSWMLIEGAAGQLADSGTASVLEQVKGLTALAATAWLVAGTPAPDLAGPRGIRRVVWWAAPLAVAVTVTSKAGVSLNGSYGVFTGVDTGQLGADAATIFACLGLLGLAITLGSEIGQRDGLLPSVVLLVVPVFSGQRASVLGLVAGLAALLAWVLIGEGRHVLRLRAPERGAILLTVLAAAALLAGAQAAGHGFDPSKTTVVTSFTSAGKVDSAVSRLDQWRVASDLVRQHPVLGWGLGKQYDYVEQIQGVPPSLVRSDLTHDIFLDVTLRAGAVGLVLLVVALCVAVAVGIRRQRRPRERVVSALGAAGAAVLVELTVRGAVESIFEKQRLVLLLGLTLGLIASTARSRAKPLSVVWPSDGSADGDATVSLRCAPLIGQESMS